MIKKFFKYPYMLSLGYKYIKIFKKTYNHPFITHKQSHKQLSQDRQAYATSVLKYLNIDIKIHGTPPRQNHILYTINHRSLLDIIVMESVFAKYDKSGLWIAKEELFQTIYGGFFKYSGNIAVDLINKRNLLTFFKKIKLSLEKNDDLNIYIFPEGERNKGTDILKFQSGASKIAKSNKLDIVPVYINDKLERVLRQAPFKEKKTIQVHFGDIIQHDRLEDDYNIFTNRIINE
jgi:1-acyl-sn-glycerol-3-phosphate acyltransferase